MKTGTIIILIGVLIFILFLCGIYWFGEAVDEDCLDKFAEKYCESVGMEFFDDVPIFDDFTCVTSNERKFRREGFDFLKEEREKCLLKEGMSFRSMK